MTTRVYELYPRFGTFTVQTIHYRGTAYVVAATSVRQAYAVAHQNIRIDPTHPHPVGIVSIYHRDSGHTLWCGCSGHHFDGAVPTRGAGIRALREAVQSHNNECPHRQLTLAERLRRHIESARPQELDQ